jgi:hypothetical protein
MVVDITTGTNEREKRPWKYVPKVAAGLSAPAGVVHQRQSAEAYVQHYLDDLMYDY